MASQSGIRFEERLGAFEDYTRGGHDGAREYESAFAAEYIDASWRFTPEVLVTTSGMAALTTIIILLSSRPQHGPVLVGRASYFENQWVLQKAFRDNLLLVDETDASGLIDAVRSLRPMAVFLDTLCNAPSLAVPHLSTILPALAEVMPKGSAVVLDNSGMAVTCQPLTMVPHFSNAFRLFVIESLNKYHQFGFDRVTGGILWTPRGFRNSGLNQLRKHLGTIMPDACVFALPRPSRPRLLRRMMRIERNTHLLAERLERYLRSTRSSLLSGVVHPALEHHPSHAWTRDAMFRGASIVLTPRYALARIALAKMFVRLAIDEARRRGVPLIAGTSFGFDITRLYVTAVNAAGISKPFLRVSAGTETATEIEAVAEVLIHALARLS